MRVISGEFRSRLLKSVPGLEVRPTPDRLRESLFNILAPALPGSVFLDAYAGSGAVGIEALSRGAALVIFIEKSKEASAVIEANLKLINAKERAMLLRGSVRKRLASSLADIVFLDPPYPLTAEYGATLETLGEAGTRAQIVVAQHSSRTALAASYGCLTRYREVRQGENTLSFYRPEPTAAEAQPEPQLHNPES